MTWRTIHALARTLPREEVRPYALALAGAEVRRAGLSAQFLVGTALEAWRALDPAPPDPRLGLVWTSLTASGTETVACLEEVLTRGEPPMPFDFLGSQPHMGALHAQALIPGLDHALALLRPSGPVELLVEAQARRRGWTHVLLGELATPDPTVPEGGTFAARWRVLARTGTRA
jgi:hypothetical protein